MVSTFIGLLDIQSWWEIPCIAHFCSLFSSTFDLPDIDIEDLESSLLADGTEDQVGLFPELIVRLLKGCDDLRKTKDNITSSNYQMFLRRLMRKKCRIYNTENTFDTDIDFQSLPVRNRLLILHSLCHFRLESKDVEVVLSNLEADSLRIEPLGFDSKNSSYWYFYGTRLYREDTKSNKTVWQVICFSEEDWRNLTKKFENTTNAKEKTLYKILNQNFLPKLPQLFREREKLRRKKLLQIRNSTRLRTQKQEKQRVLDEKISKEQAVRIELEERLRLDTLATTRSSRRRSLSTSTASGFSTYASSARPPTNSSDFILQREQRDKDDQFFHTPLISASANKPTLFKSPLKQTQSDSDFLSSEEDEENKENYRCSDQYAIESDLDSNLPEIMAPATNLKIPGRQTNNSLSSLTGNIFIPAVGSSDNSASTSTANASSTETNNNPKSKGHKKDKKAVDATDNPPPAKKKSKNSEVLTETAETLQIGMHKVLVSVKNHRDAWPFMDPVDEEIAPRYYSIIRRPMDLSRMEQKLDKGDYGKFSEFRNDFKLIVNNCRLYNGQDNEYTEMVNKLLDAFDKATNKYFDHHSDDDETLGYPDTKMNVFREKCFNKTPPEAAVAPAEAEKAPSKKKLGDESRGNKRKKKEKDKRHKKKSKSKSHVLSEDELVDESSSEDEEESRKKRNRKKMEELFSDKGSDGSSDEDNMASKKNKKKSLKDKDKDKERSKKAYLSDEDDDMVEDKTRTSSSSKSKGVKSFKKSNNENFKKKSRKKSKKKKDVDEEEEIDNEDFSEGSLVDYPVKKSTKTNQKKVKSNTVDAKKKKPNNWKKANQSESERSASVLSEDDDDAKSTPSSPFKVDLHKKYAKSCLIDDLDLLEDSFPHASVPESKASVKNETVPDISSDIPLFLDKYDLIKQRRNRGANAEEKNKSKDVKKSPVKLEKKDKNPRLRQTIEKLTAKNAKNKERTEIIDEILGLKPVQEMRDKKTIFEKLREPLESPKPKAEVDSTSFEKVAEPPKNFDDYEFPEDPPEVKEPVKPPAVKKKEVDNPPAAKSASKKTTSVKKPVQKSKNPTGKQDFTNLNHEAEQTLKDISRWLEHTPKLSEFNSASNSPSRFNNLMDDFDTVTSKLNASDFPRPTTAAIDAVPKFDEPFDDLAADTVPSIPGIVAENSPDVLLASGIDSVVCGAASSVSSSCGTPPHSNNSLSGGSTSANASSSSSMAPCTFEPKPKETPSTTQFLANPPPPPNVRNMQAKEAKRKNIKEKVAIANQPKRKDLMRTIDRLQPGKAKGNLIQNSNKTEESNQPVANTPKVKEIKNSLVVKTDENAPKLSLGSVLDTAGFGLGHLHNFCDGDNKAEKTEADENKVNADDEEKKLLSSFDTLADTKSGNATDKVVKDTPDEVPAAKEKTNSAPDLSVWFKVFGAPKKTKKQEEEEKKAEEGLVSQSQANNVAPAARQRKASTGSTISERSSFSQDADSPRIGIDERFGSYAGAYTSPIAASPIEASPIMVSPKPEEINKPTSPYALNGAIKVGFYQDTTTKSSPDKSCSPRELPSPYPQYSQHIYTSASSPNVSSSEMSGNSPYQGSSYNPSSTEATKTPVYSSTSPVANLYEQYKQPQSQESEYNSSMSPSTPHAHSPYQQPQSSPYHQSYQQPSSNSPYQVSQSSPFQATASPSSAAASVAAASPQQSQLSPLPPTQPKHSPSPQQNSPYQHPASSPYQHTNNSPFNQPNPASPYQQQQPQVTTNPTPPQQQQQPQLSLPFGGNPAGQQQVSVSVEQNDNQATFQADASRFGLNDQSYNNPNCTQAANAARSMYAAPQVPEIPKIDAATDWLQQQQQQQQNQNQMQSLYQNYATKTDNKQMAAQNMFCPTDLAASMMEQHQLENANKPLAVAEKRPGPELEQLAAKMAKRDDQSLLNKHQQLFDGFLGSMTGATGKGMNYGKQTDISTSKAFEMFNRAIAMEYSKDIPTNALLKEGGVELNKPLNMVNSDTANFAQPNQNLFNTPKIQQQQQQQQIMPTQQAQQNQSAYLSNMAQANTVDKSNDLVLLNPGHLGSYKPLAFSNTTTGMLDPMRGIQRPAMFDDPLLNLQNTTNFYDKSVPPAAHMFSSSKNLGQQASFQSALGYGSTGREHQNQPAPGNYVPVGSHVHHQAMDTAPIPAPLAPEVKPARKSKKKKASATTDQNVQNLMHSGAAASQLMTHHPQLQAAHQNNMQAQNIQGFQLYTGMKTTVGGGNAHPGSAVTVPAVGGTPANDVAAISLKSASSVSMVPGSAFNFGPTGPAGISLPAGIYSDNSYLDDFRGAPNPYYIPPGHRAPTSEAQSDKSVNANNSTAPVNPYQFLAHPSSRTPAYPFMNTPQIDPNTTFYQPYLRQQEELRTRMMLNHQGLLGSTGASSGYPQPSYRPPLDFPYFFGK